MRALTANEKSLSVVDEEVVDGDQQMKQLRSGYRV
jgi:hypothetical protein